MLLFLLAVVGFAFAELNCTLKVPRDPLSSRGLQTPYILSGCSQSIEPVFVEAAIIDRNTGRIYIYHPLVLDEGTRPAVPPKRIKIDEDSVVGIWMTSNAPQLHLIGEGSEFCINGVKGDIFGSFAHCNAAGFFDCAHSAIAENKLNVPPLKQGIDGFPCPTTRDFRFVNEKQFEGVFTSYLLLPNGQTAQNTVKNRLILPEALVIQSSIQNRLLNSYIQPSLNCIGFLAKSLDDPGQMVNSLALNELQASIFQEDPVSFVPRINPMVLTNGFANLKKLDLFRLGLDQPKVKDLEEASGVKYCRNLVFHGIKAFNDVKTRGALSIISSPNPMIANNLFTFLAWRSYLTLMDLNCFNLLGMPQVWTFYRDRGVIVSAVATFYKR
jgi:hypothetical protein